MEGINKLTYDIFYKSCLEYEAHYQELANFRDKEYKNNFEGLSNKDKYLLILHTVEHINRIVDIETFLKGEWVGYLVEYDAKLVLKRMKEYCLKQYGEIEQMLETLKKKGTLGKWYSIKVKDGYIAQCGAYGKVYIVDYPVYRTEGYCNRVSARLIRNGIPNKIIRQI